MKNRSTGRLGGFTLIELLIVVLIIGILTAVALPKYQSAVDKSRYATLMPTAKTIANSQEAFYMANGSYAEDLSNLETQVTQDASGASAQLPDGTKLEISQRESHKYVKMSKDNLDNNYIVYQAQSPNYAKEIHCEALKDSTRAERLCETLGGEKINGYLTPGYDTYVLEGTGLGMSADVADKIDQAGNSGWQACDTYPCTKTCNRPIASGYSCEGTYQEDGSYTERFCQGKVCVEKDYGEDGKMKEKRVCELQENGSCYFKKKAIYDEDGNQIRRVGDSIFNDFYFQDEDGNVTRRQCNPRYVSGNTCTKFEDNLGTEYTYDEDGNLRSERSCSAWGSDDSCSKWGSGYEYTYDENGNKTSERYCAKYSASGTCDEYYYPFGKNNDFVYDENGNVIARIPCNNVASDGSCSSTGSGSTFEYDEKGNITLEKECYNWANGACTRYGISSTAYDYDENGKLTSKRTCDAAGSSSSRAGQCWGYEYKQDPSTNKTTEFRCGWYKAGEKCSNYTEATDYTYDSDGKMLSKNSCSSWDANGCTAYSSGQEYTYDEEGNQTSHRQCDSWSGTTCSKWWDRNYSLK